jgi:peptidoglycan glycosyltransferase
MTLIAVAIAGVGLLVVQARSPLAGSEGPDRFALSLPGSARHEQRKLNSAPAYLFERLPVGRENGVFDFALAHLANQPAGTTFSSASSDPFAGSRLVEVIDAPEGRGDLRGPLRVEYSIDSDLTSRIFRILRASRVERGHVIVLDPHTGRVLAYTSTDPENFPPTRAYPAASLIKVVTAAAVLDVAPEAVSRPCRYRGSPYRLTRSRIKRPSVGREISLEGALATSNNQCFAQLAVNSVGGSAMLDAIRRFGWLDPPAPGHEAGRVNLGDDDYDLGRLGCGLAGCKITPLHAVGLAATLATGEALEPWWVDRVLDADGKELSRPPRAATRRVMSEDQAKELRRMMVRTTARGTARRAFRDRRGRPKLGSIAVAGKTGNLSGKDPNGRYEWFVGAAPADDPSIAIAVVQVQGHLWWKKSSEIAADVLSQVFCERRRCDPDLAGRFTGSLGESVSPVFLSESGH